MTAQEIRNQAIIATKAKLGLTNKAVDTWTYEDRTTYNKSLSAYILANSSQFTPQDAYIAGRVNQAAYVPEADTSFIGDIKIFGEEFGNQAIDTVDSIGGVGRGVLNTAKLAAWVIPAAALATLAIAVYGFYLQKKAGK